MAKGEINMRITVVSMYACNSCGVVMIDGATQDDVDNFMCMQEQLFAEESGLT